MARAISEPIFALDPIMRELTTENTTVQTTLCEINIVNTGKIGILQYIKITNCSWLSYKCKRARGGAIFVPM